MTIKKLLISVAIWVLPAINGFASSDDPDRSGGSAEPANYNSFGLDNVNIYNGALSVNIPLGSKYPLNGGYSYGFSLYFSPDMWFEDSINCQGNPNFDVEFAEPFQRRRLLAGFGWALTPGPELLSGPSGSYDFITSDGASHRFEFDQPGDTVAITTDGSYLRLRAMSSTFEVDYPNGNIAFFDRTSGRLLSVLNAYEEVLLSYLYEPNKITIKDSAGRTHTIVTAGSLVKELRLAAFGDIEAIYKFHSSPTELHRRGDVPDVFCGDETVQETLLNMVEMPDGSAFLIEQYTRDEMISAATPPFAAEYGNSGELKSLTLPTGGQFKWRYAKHSDANARWGPGRVIKRLIFETLPLPNSTPAQEEEQATAIWQYRNDILDRRVTIRDPLGNETEHFYKTGNIGNTEPGWNSHWFKGLPFTADTWIDSARNYKLYLSSISWDGEVDPQNPQNKLRSEYVRYEVNDPTLPSSQGGFPNPDQEKRRVASATVYHDDPTGENSFYRLESLNSEFDGFGNYRRNERWDSVSPSTVLSTITDYNRHLEEQDPKLINYWILNTFGYVQREYAGQISKTEYCFDTTTGFLTRTRKLSNFGLSRSLSDLVTVNTLEIDATNEATGNIASVALYGADITPLPIQVLDIDLCSSEFSILPVITVAGFRNNFTYAAGALRTNTVVNTIDSSPFLISVDRSIDTNTGLASITRDPAGVPTTYIYDSINRLVSSFTPGLPDTEITYCKALFDDDCQQNIVQTVTSDGVRDLSNTTLIYDGLGRKISNSFVSAKSATDTEIIKTLFAYDELNRIIAETVSEVSPDLNSSRVKTVEYDSLGRRVRAINPDGALTTLEYTGSRVSIGNYTVNTVAGPRTFSKTMVSDDMRGLLGYVEEPSGNSDSIVRTTYTYNVNSQLTSVTSGTQLRQFDYSNLGFQTTSNHSEISAPKNNSQFDVLGNPHRTQTGPRVLLTEYDAAGRPVQQMEESGPDLRMVSELFYANANTGSNKRTGKLVRAKRHNYIPEVPDSPESLLNHYVVSERYEYLSESGMLTDIATSMVAFDQDNIVHSRRDLIFELSTEYDSLGLLERIDYPLSVKAGGPADALSITIEHNHNQITKVIDNTDGLAVAELEYSRGALSSIINANLTTQSYFLDPTGMMRVADITIEKDQIPIWNSGAYTYDHSGNITAIGGNHYHYDGVNRLVNGTVNGLVQSANFDQYGNIVSLNTDGVTVDMLVDSDTNRLEDTDTSSYVYDVFGNITRWNDNSFVYDASNMIIASDISGIFRQFIYAPNSRRIGVRDTLTGGFDWILRDQHGNPLSKFHDNGSELRWLRDYIRRGQRVIAARHPSDGSIAKRYFHLDILGSTRAVSDENGLLVAEYDYFPYGEFAFKAGPESDSESLLFTGLERDVNDEADSRDDLDYMLARYYAPHLGRFLSIDPVIGNKISPQSWNRYVYAANNPVNLVDITGLQPEKINVEIKLEKRGTHNTRTAQQAALDQVTEQQGSEFRSNKPGASNLKGTTSKVTTIEVAFDNKILDQMRPDLIGASNKVRGAAMEEIALAELQRQGINVRETQVVMKVADPNGPPGATRQRILDVFAEVNKPAAPAVKTVGKVAKNAVKGGLGVFGMIIGILDDGALVGLSPDPPEFEGGADSDSDSDSDGVDDADADGCKSDAGREDSC